MQPIQCFNAEWILTFSQAMAKETTMILPPKCNSCADLAKWEGFINSQFSEQKFYSLAVKKLKYNLQFMSQMTNYVYY
ncbi:hypothetical protein C5470_10960 [Photorhabdus stackebrandtii]|uniref:Uncharacterized protein n=1 Tax=Photorhabdus stackebrandtii TaxID=1123042 RepID=A0A7X5QM89_9GAMM|nr:hypothetical protein [Photorhabdus stackebrandtii]